jgi:hypothetical protein
MGVKVGVGVWVGVEVAIGERVKVGRGVRTISWVGSTSATATKRSKGGANVQADRKIITPSQATINVFRQ